MSTAPKDLTTENFRVIMDMLNATTAVMSAATKRLLAAIHDLGIGH
jgi:hypothetical protein